MEEVLSTVLPNIDPTCSYPIGDVCIHMASALVMRLLQVRESPTS